ncbi:DNA repair and recombination protein RadB [Halocatena pleomorpha]|uniref:DNA repair and recombination protein RadB n=1 Tax=Halocatena pleomorpha TaxID=1785090 RepID=A0A3P3RCR5_9EURY|nr:DNA repair and recombination protein RadB [Halocatena pleomorpha]RRJ30253.1 DNA repair and recombination protein RadB [Halocatena pleomorpha]
MDRGRFYPSSRTRRVSSTPITTGCSAIDDLLGGGFDRGAITQLYGPPASGKTNLALSAAIETAAAGERVLYIDTEDLSIDRFEQLAYAQLDRSPIKTDAETEADRTDINDLTSRVIISEALDFQEQEEAVKDAAEIAQTVDLIVLDSATGYYRLERTERDDGDALRAVARQVTHLLSLARRYDLAVLITNQVFTDPDTERAQPLGGHTLMHWSGTVLRLERFRGGNRRAQLEKHRSKPTGERARFQITDTGISTTDTP